MNTRISNSRNALQVLCAGLFAAAVLAGASDTGAAQKYTRADLDVVDCLLPGQVRVLGTRTYLTQRRPVKATAADCRKRGGEYVDYDRADMKTALNVWLEAAQGGDAEAQNNVGEIYERGLGGEPNYEAAAEWYQKAADQKYSRAQLNLGTLYEQGLGVPQDKLKALNLYRESWGLPADSVVFQSAAKEESDALRLELQKAIDDKDARIKDLNNQINQLQNLLKKVKAPATGTVSPDTRAEIDALNRQVEELKKKLDGEQTDRARSNEKLVALRAPTAVAGASPALDTMKPADVRKALGVSFGRYYALVIGNQHYQAIDNLQTPISDAQRAAKVLKDRYGFSVKVLEDANDQTMMNALNDLSSTLKEGDNLLIYYAGHGSRKKSGTHEIGYWLGVNADKPPNDALWVQNERITAHLLIMPAQRVLVVSDACYAGLLSPDPLYRNVDPKLTYTVDYIKFKMPKRSRLLLSSGGDEPVLDKAGGGTNSVFAESFLQELETNTGVLSVPELFARIARRVQTAASRNNFAQTPELSLMKGAGHEMGGDFFFVPKT